VLFVANGARAASPLVGLMHGRMRVMRDGGGVERVFTHDGQSLVTVAQVGAQRTTLLGAPVTPMRLADLHTAVRAAGGAR
jgi:hypothetical protein